MVLNFFNKIRKKDTLLRVNPLKVRMGVFLKNIFTWLFKVIPPKTLQPFLKWFAFPPLRGIINKIWIPVLRQTGHRNLLCEWSLFLSDKLKRPGYYLMHIENLLFASRFKEAQIYLKKTEQIIFATPRYSHFSKKLHSLNVIVDIELNGVQDWHLSTVYDDNIIASHFYHRLWMGHNMRLCQTVVDAGKLYFSATGYVPQSLQQVWTSVYEPNGLASYMEEMLQKSRISIALNQNNHKHSSFDGDLPLRQALNPIA